MSERGPDDELWRALLTGTHPALRRYRPVLRALPSDPRCKLCNAPFSGVGAPLMRLMGKRPSNMNPHYCNVCDEMAREHRGGAEIELTLVFADVRGSTRLAEQTSPGAFGELMNRFYAVAIETFTNSGGFIDKLVGDEVIALYLPAFAGAEHAQQAINAGRKLLLATGHADKDGPWLPIGVGINTGVAYVGSVGPREGPAGITALGDAVNVTARLVSKAGPGEIVVSETAYHLSGLAMEHERRELDLEGHSAKVPAVVLRVGSF